MNGAAVLAAPGGTPHGICLAGPTGTGKTALALALAEHLRRGGHDQALEVISVDSALVYRGLDVGTAKPSAEERARVPHHLIDIIEPTEAWSAQAFADAARTLGAEIRARGRVPLLVGGTMLYFKALREGLDELPVADRATRAAIDADAAARGWPALHAELARVDPPTAARLAPNDAQRIQRALEVWRMSGQPLSALQSGPRSADVERWPMLSLEPSSRGWLHERLARRFDAMLAAGLIDEVRQLRARGDLHAGLPSMRCVGYRQAWQALDEGTVDAAALERLRDAGIAATRQLAKRQLTWLRGMTRAVVACDAPDAEAQAIAHLQRLVDAAAR